MFQKDTLNESISLVGRETVELTEDELDALVDALEEAEYAKTGLKQKTLRSYVRKARATIGPFNMDKGYPTKDGDFRKGDKRMQVWNARL